MSVVVILIIPPRHLNGILLILSFQLGQLLGLGDPVNISCTEVKLVKTESKVLISPLGLWVNLKYSELI